MAKDAFRIVAFDIIEHFIYAKMPTNMKNMPKCQNAKMKKSLNKAHLDNGTFEQIVTHREREKQLNGLEAPDELQINTVSP